MTAAKTPAVPLAEWQAEVARRGKLDCKFRCPLCKHEASPNDWKKAGGDPQRAPTQCIGRLTGDVQLDPETNWPKEGTQPCNWSASGLFGTLNDGTKVALPNGEEMWVFSFAD